MIKSNNQSKRKSKKSVKIKFKFINKDVKVKNFRKQNFIKIF